MRTSHAIILTTAISCLGFSSGALAFVAVTDPAAESNSPGTSPGAVVGDTFTVPDGSFATYAPGLGDPIIADNDLADYQFTLNGTVTSVNPTTEVVSYTGTYRIFYTDTGSIATDPTVSAGTLSLTADFLGVNPYVLDGTLTQTQGPSVVGFTGFPENTVDFVGTYDQTSTAGGFVQGDLVSVPNISTVPDSASSFLLLSLAGSGMVAVQRRLRA